MHVRGEIARKIPSDKIVQDSDKMARASVLSLLLEGVLYLRTEAFSLAVLGIAIHHVCDRGRSRGRHRERDNRVPRLGYSCVRKGGTARGQIRNPESSFFSSRDEHRAPFPAREPAGRYLLLFFHHVSYDSMILSCLD